jgi:hypothetical protein
MACSDSNEKDGTYFSNVVKTMQIGDSVRIEIEQRGDTLIKHYIDLKGTSDDNFDNSFTTTCVYKKFKNDTGINSAFYLTKNGYRLYFDSKKIASYCDSMISTLTSDYDKDVNKPRYESLKRRVLMKTDTIGINDESELILNFTCKIIDEKTNEKPKSILVEFYRTEFSGGKNFFILTNKNDTVELFHHMDFIN